MKKLITKNKIIQKTAISIIIVSLFSFAVPVRSQAGIGGILLDPIVDLLGTVFDVVVGGLQVFLVDGELNNSDDGGILNAFLAKPDAFLENENGKYDEFQYPDGTQKPIETIKESELDKSYYIPTLKYTPDKIFANKIPALDINFINPKEWETTEEQERSVAIQLHEVVAGWYVSLKNLSIVGLMLILVYLGIRIVISSTAADKSKYKQMLMDWLIAMCLLFCLHYIMTFTVTIVDKISEAINGADEEKNGNSITVQITADGGDGQNDAAIEENGKNVQFSTDLMGLIRFKMQYNNGWTKLLYLIFYMAMVMYTCLFTFYYLKRVIVIAFLTLISPLVVLTYPIDKLKDGKAQAFDMWLKEYVFNALLQPFHLIIYTIFVGSAIELSAKNPIFAIISLAFITPAEKLLRKFFGFEKASTAGTLGGLVSVAGGAAAMNLAKHLIPSKGGSKGGSGGGKGNVRVKTPDADVKKLAETGIGNNGTNDSNKNETLEQGGPALSNSNANVNENRNIQGSQQIDSWDDNDMYLHPENYQDAFNSPTLESTSSETEQPGKQRNSFRDAFRWTENDSRGLGQWAGDSMKNIGREIRSEIFRNKNRSKCYEVWKNSK